MLMNLINTFLSETRWNTYTRATGHFIIGGQFSGTGFSFGCTWEGGRGGCLCCGLTRQTSKVIIAIQIIKEIIHVRHDKHPKN